MEIERISLTKEELEDFDFTGGYEGAIWKKYLRLKEYTRND